jgi:plastocyanin
MGAVGIVAGPREFEKKEKPGVTEGVSDPASVGATVTVRGITFAFDGPLVTEPGVLEWAKGTTVNLVFRNTDSTAHNLVVRGGEGDNAVKFETALIEEGAVQVLTVRIDVPGEYEIVSEGGPVAVKGIVRVL